jgi:hypothetical protein
LPHLQARAGAERSLDLRRSLPLEQISSADEKAIESAEDCVRRHHRLVWQEHHRQRELLRIRDSVATNRDIVREPRLVARGPQQ